MQRIWNKIFETIEHALKNNAHLRSKNESKLNAH